MCSQKILLLLFLFAFFTTNSSPLFVVVVFVLVFLSLALALCRSFSRWASLACRLLSLSFSISIFQILGRDNLSKLNALDNTDTETISVFRLVFIDCFTVSALQDAGGHAISRQKNLELHLGCHTCWLSHFTIVCLWCGLTDGRRSRDYKSLPKFLRSIHNQIFLPMVLGAPLRAPRARESSANTGNKQKKENIRSQFRTPPPSIKVQPECLLEATFTNIFYIFFFSSQLHYTIRKTA